MQSDVSSDSINPSFEQAYNMMEQGPYSDPGLPLGFNASSRHGAMNIQSSPFTVGHGSKNSSQVMVPRLKNLDQVSMNQRSYMNQQQQQQVYSDRSYYEQASHAYESVGSQQSQNSSGAFGHVQAPYPQQS